MQAERTPAEIARDLPEIHAAALAMVARTRGRYATFPEEHHKRFLSLEGADLLTLLVRGDGGDGWMQGRISPLGSAVAAALREQEGT